MSLKSYLSRQYRLLGITTNDLFTDEEMAQLNAIGDISRQLDVEGLTKEERKELTAQKKALSERLRQMFSEYPVGKPRKINPKKVCRKKDGEYLEWIDLRYIKDSYIIQEFENEWSRCNGIEINTFCPIKINIKWNIQHGDLLKQAFINGIEMDYLDENGEVRLIHFDYFTAAAGQMRTDRAAFVEHDAMQSTWKQLFAGMTPEIIDAHGGINLNKISAYIGLVTGASERWELEDDTYLDVDNIIVVPDIESHVTCDMDHIDTKYQIERGTHTEKVNQCDGVGWMLPRLVEKSKVKAKNRMIRGPWIKGLITEFDYIEFAKEHNIEPIIKDFWGKEHNLISENILLILTESQLKLAKYYDSWDQYKDMYHENCSYISATNYEEDNIGMSELNYQFLQTLLDITDDEIISITDKDYNEIKELGTNYINQQKALGCFGKVLTPMHKALLAYPELLRDGLFRHEIKDIKTANILNAQSGKLNLHNKRLFVVPDPYAAWERLLLGVEEPTGLLNAGEIYTGEESYNNINEVDLLRSPHLYIEHCIRKIIHNNNLKKWFNTNAVYTSFNDIASRILQFDFDGDELNLLNDKNIINAAQRTINNHSILPLFYDAQKAGKQSFTKANRFDSLITAHYYGGEAIGGVSNTLTKLWNSKQDKIMASRICCMNNLIIDAAKTGKIIPYPDDIAKPINQLSHSRMPWFFQFTPNGRTGSVKCLGKPQKGESLSPMNKIAMRFEELKKQKLVLNYDNLGDFNPYMLLDRNPIVNRDIYIWFDKEIGEAMRIRSEIKQHKMRSYFDFTATNEWVKENIWWDEKLEEIKRDLINEFKDEDTVYDSLVVEMFMNRAMSESRKQQFWILFGERALNNIKNNLKNCYICEHPGCRMKVPKWDINHAQHHQGCDEMHTKCRDCGVIFEVKGNSDGYCKECKKKYKERAKIAAEKCKMSLKEKRAKHQEETKAKGLW